MIIAIAITIASAIAIGGIVIARLNAANGVFAATPTESDTFRIERSMIMKAPPEKIFALINDFRNWPQWLPREKSQVCLKRTYSGELCGKGAVYEWYEPLAGFYFFHTTAEDLCGKGAVDEREDTPSTSRGREEIIESIPPVKITYKSNSITPSRSENTTTITLETSGGSTTVKWSTSGRLATDDSLQFVMKIMSMFININTVFGKGFETALTNIKAIAEQS